MIGPASGQAVVQIERFSGHFLGVKSIAYCTLAGNAVLVCSDRILKKRG